MKFSELKKTIDLMNRFLPKKSRVPELGYFGFFGSRAFVYNGTQALVLHKDFGFTGYVKGEDFKEFFKVTKLSKEESSSEISLKKREGVSDILDIFVGDKFFGSLEHKDNKLLESFQENFSGSNKPPKVRATIPLRKDFLEILKVSLSYCKKNSGVEVLNGVYLEGRDSELHLYSSNNVSLFHHKYPKAVALEKPLNVVLPYQFCDFLIRAGISGSVLHIGNYMASVSTDGLVAVSGLYSVEEPLYRHIRNVAKRSQELVECSRLGELSKYISKIKKELSKDNKYVELIFGKDKIVAQSPVDHEDGCFLAKGVEAAPPFKVHIGSALFENFLKHVDKVVPTEIGNTSCIYGESEKGYDITISGMGD